MSNETVGTRTLEALSTLRRESQLWNIWTVIGVECGRHRRELIWAHSSLGMQRFSTWAGTVACRAVFRKKQKSAAHEMRPRAAQVVKRFFCERRVFPGVLRCSYQIDECTISCRSGAASLHTLQWCPKEVVGEGVCDRRRGSYASLCCIEP